MSNPDFFPNIDPKNKSELIENDSFDESICPSCNFILSKHSVKQIINCALKEIQIIRNKKL